MSTTPLLKTEIPGFPCRRGKVRDVYDLGDRLVIVATDRISAFDWVLPTGIPDKGRVLTGLTLFWLDHPAGAQPPARAPTSTTMGPPFAAQADVLARPQHAGPQDRGRADRVRGPRLPGRLGLEGISPERHGLRHHAAAGLQESQQLPEPIFTPATKEETRPRHQHLVRADGRDHRAGRGRGAAAAEPGRLSPRPPSTPGAAASSSPTRSSSGASCPTAS